MITGLKPFEEEQCQAIRIGSLTFKVITLNLKITKTIHCNECLIAERWSMLPLSDDLCRSEYRYSYPEANDYFGRLPREENAFWYSTRILPCQKK